MRILHLSYIHDPQMAPHEVRHEDITTIQRVGWPAFIESVRDWKPDLIIEREWNDEKARYEPLYQALPDVKKAWWWIDAHVNYPRMINWYAKYFDYLFLAVSRYVEPARVEHPDKYVCWLPNCWAHGELIPNTFPKDYEISFVCRWTPEVYFGKRIACINKLKQHYGDRVYVVNSGDMLNIVRRSKVSLNNCFDNDLNFRYFEVLGCGTELVCDPCDDLYKTPGMTQRVSIYQDLDDMIRVIDSVLDGRIKHDMTEVQEWLRMFHTVESRYNTMLIDIWGYKNETLSD